MRPTGPTDDPAAPPPPAVRLGDRNQCLGYAVVAVETSGLSPSRHRVVEVAVALCDPDGTVTGLYETLVDPSGPVGDFQSHGLFDDDVATAPAFGDIAPRLVELLGRRVVVAHNARFDVAFLEREFQRRGRPAVPPLTSLCTMREAASYLPDAPRFTLAACCDTAGIPLDDTYGAAAKALGTAGLLGHYLSLGAGEARHWQQARTVAASLRWPRRLPLAGDGRTRVWTRQDAHRARRAREEAERARRRDAVAYLERARAFGPPMGVGEGPDSYLAVLDAALEDRVITPQEATDLAELAVSLGITEEQRKDLDRLYVTTLAASMVAAGPIDREERADLTRVAGQLGIPRIAVDDIIAMARSIAEGSAGGTGTRMLARGRPLVAGQHVLLHGYLAVGRGELERRTARARLVIAAGVHDRVDVLVVADPDESADRTYWARQRGIRVLIEPVFLALLADLERVGDRAADAQSVSGAYRPSADVELPRTTSGFVLPGAVTQVSSPPPGPRTPEAGPLPVPETTGLAAAEPLPAGLAGTPDPDPDYPTIPPPPRLDTLVLPAADPVAEPAATATTPTAAPAPVVPSDPEPRTLVRGQAVALDELAAFAGVLRIEAAWEVPEAPPAADADVVALVLRDDRRVTGDDDLVFYNQPLHPTGAVGLAGKLQDGRLGSDSVDIDVTALPPGGSRVLAALALDAAPDTTFAHVPVVVGIVDPVTRRRLAEFRLIGGAEKVMVLAEVYRRGESWRLRAVGQGYAEGLAALVTEHGVVVDE